jgi:hypothetical protein
MWMPVRQSDEAAMAEFRAAHPEHVAAELEYYDEIAAQQVVAAAANASSSAAGASSSAGPSNVVDISSGTEMKFSRLGPAKNGRRRILGLVSCFKIKCRRWSIECRE